MMAKKNHEHKRDFWINVAFWVVLGLLLLVEVYLSFAYHLHPVVL